uniref:Uncharacterized protein n=1 Tax=Aegilops tauschii subsp. strangulata TaxID=200361 RepID=A0A453NEZ3_AEGTS
QCFHKDLHLEAVGKEDSTSLGSIGDEISLGFVGSVAGSGGEDWRRGGGGYLCRLVTGRVGEGSQAVTVRLFDAYASATRSPR